MTETTLQPDSDSGGSETVATTESKGSAASGSSAKAPGSLAAMVRHLLKECPSKQAVYDTLLRVSMERLSVSVARADYRVGAVLLSEIRHSENLEEAAARQFSEKFLARISQEVRTSSLQEPQFKMLERGDQQLMIAAAPVIDIATNQVDGVLTVMLSGGSHRPEFVLPILDGITATAGAVLVGRSIAAAKASGPIAVKTETANIVKGQLPQAATIAAGAAAVSTTTTAATTPNSSQPATSAQAASTNAVHAQAAALSKTAHFGNLKEFGYTLVNSISNQFQCEQVAFGVEQNQKVKLHAISGIADFKASSPGVASIRQAMEECLDEENVIAVPAIDTLQEAKAIASRPIHQQWSTECNNSAVCSLPLLSNGEVVAVVSLRRSGSQPFTQPDVARLRGMLEAYGPAVRIVERAGQPVGSRIKSAVKSKASNTMQKGAWGRRIALLALLAVGLWFCFGTMTYEPLCRSTITAANLRHFSAPFDGQLKSVLVTPGQKVSKNDVLVEFDTSELQLQLVSLEQQLASIQVQVKQAISEGELGQASMANARQAVLATEIRSIRTQISEATIVAPADGIVVLSDLQQRIGQEFPQGEEILQFVAEGDWLLEIEVPDSLVSVVAAQQQGTFAPASDPTNKHVFQIEHVDGAASVVKDRNVFLAHAGFADQPDQMMTGMEGTSKLTTVDRPVWWVALHGVIDWARMNFWV